MEVSFLLLERRQSETLDGIIGPLLGATWDAATLLGESGGPKPRYTWNRREKRPKVFLPLSAALTQDPKFYEHLKAAAAKERWAARDDKSVLDRPKWVAKNIEYVDLSQRPKEEFLRIASRVN